MSHLFAYLFSLRLCGELFSRGFDALKMFFISRKGAKTQSAAAF
jgi:hypothetical protein